ncbi:enoyl-CoA hydratase/isomerase family protein [Chryseosolibacter indicus]|uniref:Enoyl-CoA hydratase/isomerase family protein n=1 Tax=Chryseosolibacter indicus TaxID=2782351 RepID=A0ABS5VR88_9BACT|nr:enoyl-CoA hydratase-related protein [Chryseosolibacter indicus]MBT1702526.1 enoyl-CoA hydratase/isomerase family protein [Chryseosolibacter indicus]
MTTLQYSIKDRIAYITLNRPEKRNALSFELVSELKEAFKQAEEDDSVKIIVLSGNGEAFCAGADLEYLQLLQGFSYEQNYADSSHLKELFLQIYQLKKIVIAQVHGPALAGGCGLATVCDFVFASHDATFGYTEVKIGFVPAIVMVFLLRKIGEAKAKQLLLTGTLISAEQANAINLINAVAPSEELESYVFNFATNLITTNSSYSMNLTKQMIAKVQSLSLDDALTFASEMNAKARQSDDCQRGISAFLNKEKISW